MIASLPMYDRPETAAANDRYWAAIAAHLDQAGFAAPDRLTRTGDLWAHWESPDLLLSQTCGLPYRARLHGKVQIVAVPDYRLETCPPGHYASHIVVRADDAETAPEAWKNKRMAFNELRSQSGWAAMVNHAKGLGTTFLSSAEMGSHRAAAQAVAERRADIACIDAQTWRMIAAYDPWATQLKIIDMTVPTPGLPLITALGTPPDLVAALRAAVAAAIAELSAADRDILNLYDLVDVPSQAYLDVPTPAA